MQLWIPDPDEKERYWFHIDVIKTWSPEEQAHFMNGAYLVADKTYAGKGGNPRQCDGKSVCGSCDSDGGDASTVAAVTQCSTKLSSLPTFVCVRASPSSLRRVLPQHRIPHCPTHPHTLAAGVRFGVESDKGEFMNHSCEPNCGALRGPEAA